jgi:hypothetical protein
MDWNRFAELYVSSFWVWAGLTFGIGALIHWVYRFYCRTIRHLNIRKHGYPGGDLIDADGDIVHPNPPEAP